MNAVDRAATVPVRQHPDADATRPALYVDGRWVGATSRAEPIAVIDPTTERPVGSVPSAGSADARAALNAAERAFPVWSTTPVADRVAALRAIADALAERADALVELIACEVGSPLDFGRGTQVNQPIAVTRGIADAAAELDWEEAIDRVLVLREAAGVAVAITPWNYPLHQAMAKAAAALAAGCTIVLKPSGLAPLSAFAIADAAEAVGLPPGVVNIVTGSGAVVGEVLAGDPRVAVVSLTGSNASGRRVMELAAPNATRVTLELGGKSATVVLDDAELDRVIPDATVAAFRNSGQNCSALSRLIVPRRFLADVERLAAAAADGVTVGDPFDPATRMGPVVSADQRRRIRDFLAIGLDEGARLVAGGAEPPDGLTTGWFVRPTVFSDVSAGMRIAREEIFGPVLAIVPYDGDDDAAIGLANDSDYGLSGAVWSADPARAERAARRIRTGRIAINGGSFNTRAPFGGVKRSGFGRELGRYGIDEYLALKTLQR